MSRLWEKEKEPLRERLAYLCHEQWSGWMRYLFSKCEPNLDGSLTIPKWAVERWMRQMTVKYPMLSEAEQASDQKEADRFLAEIGDFERNSQKAAGAQP